MTHTTRTMIKEYSIRAWPFSRSCQPSRIRIRVASNVISGVISMAIGGRSPSMSLTTRRPHAFRQVVARSCLFRYGPRRARCRRTPRLEAALASARALYQVKDDGQVFLRIRRSNPARVLRVAAEEAEHVRHGESLWLFQHGPGGPDEVKTSRFAVTFHAA